MRFTMILTVTLAFFAISHEAQADRHLTILFTNDVESAYDPIPAYWRSDVKRIGGLPQLSTLVDEIRATADHPVFLFDSGDIFTGSLATATNGRLALDLMTAMDYDAMAIGNHEFEFPAEVFALEKNRASFPVLAANIFYKGTNHPFSRPHTIIERGGLRLGVVGIMGKDAATALIPSHIAGLDVRDPAPYVQASVDAIRGSVDLVVLLTHMGKTAPMQTDAEIDPAVHRDINADIALAGAVTGVDILLGGHADAGTEEPVIHPETGTIIMQTYGQATHLGYLSLTVDDTGAVTNCDCRLIPVDADKYAGDPTLIAKIEAARALVRAELFTVIGRSETRLNRLYTRESDLGNLMADMVKKVSGADIGMVHSGGLRKDLPQGDIRFVDIRDIYPFVDDLVVVDLTGAQLKAVLEQSLTLERGLMQLSGLTISYRPKNPRYSRLASANLPDGSPVDDAAIYSVAVPEIIAQGADLYKTFNAAENRRSAGAFEDILRDYFSGRTVTMPKGGRQIIVD